MKRYKSRAQLKDLAKERLTGNFSHALLILFLADLINRTVLSLATALLPSGGILGNAISVLGSAVVSVFIGILQTGIAYCFLSAACGRKTSVGDLFYGFQEMPEKAVRISLIQVAINTICLLPYQVCLLQYIDTFNMVWIEYALIAMLIGYVIMIPLKLALSQTYFLLLDFPDSSVSEIIKTSIRIMKGHKLRLFLLELSFLPLQILCMFTLGIGNLWLNPYMQMTYTLFFLDLMNPEQSHA